MIKKLLVALLLAVLPACGNDYQLIRICPNGYIQVPISLSPEDITYVQACTPETEPRLPDPHEETIPWGITRVGGPLISTNRTVWILDTGIELDNPDLNVDIERSISFSTVEGEELPWDGHGHGTHVAGTVAAKQNGILVVGVAPGQQVVAVKVLSNAGWGKWEWAIAGIEYVINNAEPGDVVNMSLGGYAGEKSALIREPIRRAADMGIRFSISAGNNADNIDRYDPASIQHPGVYTISASDSDDCMALFSNFGEGVDYAAPGVNILSLHSKLGMKYWQGTSMSAPHVSALLLFGEPNHDGHVTCYNRTDKRQDDGFDDPIAHY